MRKLYSYADLGKVNIPCGIELLGEHLNEISNFLVLIVGPPSCGKSIYCKYFFEMNSDQGSLNLFVGTNLTKKKFENFISYSGSSKKIFVNPFLNETLISNSKDKTEDNSLIDTYDTLANLITQTVGNIAKDGIRDVDNEKDQFVGNNAKQVCFLLDSLNQIFSSFEEHKAMNFINRLCLFLSEFDVTGIFTFSSAKGLSDPIVEKIASIFDGIIEMDFDEKASSNTQRKIRLSSLKNTSVASKWQYISYDGTDAINLVKQVSLYCDLCDRQIFDTPIYYNELVFHEEHLDVYKKLTGAYGVTGLANTGTVGVQNANFFFVDIVGLSNPLLSVRKQIEKIQLLNKLINTCEAFIENRDKIIFPTGDGMAIAFIHNPELPFLLSMQLHSELNDSNSKLDKYSKLGIRIGLANGPVFVVNDMNNNQNMWGPGIILARRVMDMGDEGHILIERNLAESLINLDEKYRGYIHLVGDYSIKHGQIITLYSAYSNEFGNYESPEKFRKYDLVDKYMFDLVDKYMMKKQELPPK
jgi:class 3 adenylate cyclase/archaellum biogenesis ATPase FlaH